MASINAKVRDFFYEDIIYQFGIPKILILDNENQFDSKEFRDFCEELSTEQRFTSIGYPQTNGVTEVTNRTILQELKKWLDKLKGKWLEERSSVLCSHRTTPRTATGETPCTLCFGVDAIIPAEISHESL